MLTTARRLRSDLKVFYITHSESVEDDGHIVGYKIKTIGKALDNQIVMEGLFTICLYTHVDEDKDGTPIYNFVTNRFRNIPAKSPMGMFDETLIPNDLKNVCDIIDAYYDEELPTAPPQEETAPTTKKSK